MKLKNPILFLIFLIFSLLNVADIITALFILPGESNPLFLLLGRSIYVLILGKALLIYAVWWYYHRNIYPNNFTYYLLILVLMFGSLIMGLGVYSNVIGILNPVEIQEAAAIPDQVKIKMYVQVVSIIYFLPSLFCMLTFIVYDKSRKYVIINEKYFEDKSWILNAWKKFRRKK